MFPLRTIVLSSLFVGPALVACGSGDAGRAGGGTGGSDAAITPGSGGAGAGGAPATGGAHGSGAGNGGVRADSGTGGAAAGTGGSDGGTADAGAGGSGEPDGAVSSEDAAACDAACDVTAGVTVGCARRFLYGVNYAWSSFGADFGGIAMWNQPGISGDRQNVLQDLTDMRANGVDVVRWWVWPQLRGEGVRLGSDRTPVGLGGTAIADAEAALELAAQAGVHVQFTFFSFDDFRPDVTDSGLFVPSLQPIVVDATKRAALMENAVRPFVQAVSASAHADRAVSWDVINEPEWAISGSNPYGDQPYTPQSNILTVTHAEMETFVKDAVAAIRADSGLPVTVGGSAAKWAKAWSRSNLDFYTLHIYDWVNQYWPYTQSPSELGVTDRPLVMGEFPVGGLTGVSYAQMVTSWFEDGYAGAMGWAVSDASFGWDGAKADVKAFADQKGCRLRYVP